jgi:hypothetical protein
LDLRFAFGGPILKKDRANRYDKSAIRNPQSKIVLIWYS